MTLSDPPWEGAKLTWRRRLNLYLQRLEHRLGRTKLWSKPCKLTVEATNICNLRCPGCFTGTNQDGRARSHMSLELFNQLMDELGRICARSSSTTGASRCSARTSIR